jgi:hypothetical protein
MRQSRSVLVLGAMLGLALAACSSAASPSPAAVTSPSPSPATTSASPSPAAASASAGLLPSLSLHGDAALEAMLPDQIGGTTLQKFSFQGAGAFSSGASGSQELQDALGQIGKSPNDVSFAVAASTDSGLTIGAFRVNGADANNVVSAFIQAGQKANPGTTVSDASISGKSVKKVVDPSETKPTYVYAHGDVMFFVQADSDALLNEVFGKLP